MHSSSIYTPAWEVWYIKTHDSESRGQEEAGRMRDEQVSYLHVAPL